MTYELSREDAKKLLENEEVQASIDYHTELAFDNILVYFGKQPELGILRIKTKDEVNELALSDFFELFYTDDDTFAKLYPKQTLYGEASLSKHFRSAIVFIVVSAVEGYMGVEQNYIWNNLPELYEECCNEAAKKYYQLMSFNDLYTMSRDYPDRLLRIYQHLQKS